MNGFATIACHRSSLARNSRSSLAKRSSRSRDADSFFRCSNFFVTMPICVFKSGQKLSYRPDISDQGVNIRYLTAFEYRSIDRSSAAATKGRSLVALAQRVESLRDSSLLGECEILRT